MRQWFLRHCTWDHEDHRSPRNGKQMREAHSTASLLPWENFWDTASVEESQVGLSGFPEFGRWNKEPGKSTARRCVGKSMGEDAAHASAEGPLKTPVGADQHVHVKNRPEVGKDPPRRMKDNSIWSSHRVCNDTYVHRAEWKPFITHGASSRRRRRS